MSNWKLDKELPILAYPVLVILYISGLSVLFYPVPSIPENGRFYIDVFLIFFPLWIPLSYILRQQWKRLVVACAVLLVCTLGTITHWGGLLIGFVPNIGLIIFTIALSYNIWVLAKILKTGTVLEYETFTFHFSSTRPVIKEREPIHYWLIVSVLSISLILLGYIFILGIFKEIF